MRGDYSVNVSRRVRVEDGVPDFNCPTAYATADGSRVAADCAVTNRYYPILVVDAARDSKVV
jgi:hypothetical protein